MAETIKIPVLLEDGVEMPHYASSGAAGADIRANLKSDIVLEPGQTKLIPTGVRVEIPHGYEIQIRPRSGLAAKHGVTVLNTPGTIDSDYRGEIQVILINHGRENFIVTSGMRIAQMVVAPVTLGDFVRADGALAASTRGEGGFGHTGTH
jgi:dUTP pyrophosphatase